MVGIVHFFALNSCVVLLCVSLNTCYIPPQGWLKFSCGWSKWFLYLAPYLHYRALWDLINKCLQRALRFTDWWVAQEVQKYWFEFSFNLMDNRESSPFACCFCNRRLPSAEKLCIFNVMDWSVKHSDGNLCLISHGWSSTCEWWDSVNWKFIVSGFCSNSCCSGGV